MTSRSISDARAPASTASASAADAARLGLLPFALLMEQEDDGQDDQRRDERQAGALLHVAREIEEVADRPREDDDQGDREAAEQHPVLATHHIHGIDRTLAQSGCAVK